MQPEQRSMTVIVPIMRGQEKPLKDLLTAIGRDIGGNTHIQFARFPSIHFARWAVIPPADTQDPNGPPSQLVFGTDHDGPDEALIGEAVGGTLDALDAIYSHCEGWPGPGDKARAAEYFLSHRIPYGARHIACRGRTVQQLKDAAAAHSRMEKYVNTVIRPARAGQGDVLDGPDAARRLAAIRDGASPIPSIPGPPLNWQLPLIIAGVVGAVGGGLYLLGRRSPALGLLGAAALVGGGKPFWASCIGTRPPSGG